MNLHHRFSVPVRIARPLPVPDALGSVREGFAAPHQALSARILPGEGTLSPAQPGLVIRGQLTLLLPCTADIAPGDGVWIDRDDKPHRCLSVRRYPLHTQVSVERIAP